MAANCKSLILNNRPQQMGLQDGPNGFCKLLVADCKWCLETTGPAGRPAIHYWPASLRSAGVTVWSAWCDFALGGVQVEILSEGTPVISRVFPNGAEALAWAEEDRGVGARRERVIVECATYVRIPKRIYPTCPLENFSTMSVYTERSIVLKSNS